MKRIKTIVSFLCAAALALTLLVMPSSASGGLFSCPSTTRCPPSLCR
ncbi:MAG: hypothetical protein ACLSCQ_01550 [Evtepia gabavorous]